MKTISMLLLLVFYQTACFSAIYASSQTKVIESFHVKSDIRYRLATTEVESVIRNTADQAQEIFFEVTLPKEAFIVSFSMKIDGKVYNGEVKEKAVAKKEYQAAVDKGQSAGHVRQAPRHSNMFEVSTNVANGSAATFTLTYQEMLRRKFSVYEHEIHVNPGQAVADFLIEIFIQENKPLRVVKTPTLRKGSLLTNKIEVEDRLTTVDRPSAKTAHITYRPSVADQGDSGMSASFVVEYDVEHSLSGDVLVVDGYFVHFFAPDLPPMPKDIVFVLDVSGSMYGNKIQQLKQAMLKILSDLQPDDKFNIITFSSDIDQWKPQLVNATKEVIDEAKRFIQAILANGGTDINNGLLSAIKELKAREDNQRVGMIFFLTDGEATKGVVDSEQIIANVLDHNGNSSAIFGLAFGTGADYDLLTKISGQNSGFARKIYEDSDAALQVASLYEEISAVSVKDISINYLPSSVDQSTVTNNKFPVVYKGSEVIICGEMTDNPGVFQMEVVGKQKSGSVDLTLEVDDVNELIIDTDDSLNTFFTIPRDFSGIVEKMWAYLTIKQYLKQKEIYASNATKVEELNNKILQISLKYKFVTPLTSMVVTKPDSPEKPVESVLKDSRDPVHSARDHKQQYNLPPQSMYSQHHPVPNSVDGTAYFLSFGGGLRGKNRGIPFKFTHNAPSTLASRSTSSTNATATTATSSATTGFLLAAILADASNLSICMEPKNIKDGKYKLIQSRNGVEVDIETICSGKNCKDTLIKALTLKSNGNITEISVDEFGNWVYQNATGFTITQQANKDIKISAKGLEIHIYWVPIQRYSKKYYLSFKLNSVKGHKDLIGKMLKKAAKHKNKNRKGKVSNFCSQIFVDTSMFINNKMAARYRISN